MLPVYASILLRCTLPGIEVLSLLGQHVTPCMLSYKQLTTVWHEILAGGIFGGFAILDFFSQEFAPYIALYAIDFSRCFWHSTSPCPIIFEVTKLLAASMSPIEWHKSHTHISSCLKSYSNSYMCQLNQHEQGVIPTMFYLWNVAQQYDST